jgi:hypothetical protein
MKKLSTAPFQTNLGNAATECSFFGKRVECPFS